MRTLSDVIRVPWRPACALAPGLLLMCLLAPLPAWALDMSARYRACLAKIDENADAAFDEALAWYDLGGGAAARHCQNLALVALGHYGEAATRLERLAGDPGAGDKRQRAEILSQAGNAWLLEGQPQAAYNALTRALELEPTNTAMLIDRARASALGEDFAAARDDLDLVLDRAPGEAEARVLRATARRALGDLRGAREDADRALSDAPDSPEAWLERGIIRHFEGDSTGAEADWRRALTLAPGSAASDAARMLLERRALGLPLEDEAATP